MMRKARQLIFFTAIVLFFSLSFSSCSDSVPQVLNVASCMVFDYADYDSEPVSRLSVFVQTDCDIRLMDSFVIEHSATGLRWDCHEPVRISEKGKNWYGALNFQPPEGEKLPAGRYGVYCKDYAENECSGYFNLTDRSIFLSAHAEDFPEIIKTSRSLVYALYDEDDTLIYYDEKLEDWNSDQDIVATYNNAFKLRKCYLTNGGAVMCIMPPVQLQNISNEEN